VALERRSLVALGVAALLTSGCTVACTAAPAPTAPLTSSASPAPPAAAASPAPPAAATTPSRPPPAVSAAPVAPDPAPAASPAASPEARNEPFASTAAPISPALAERMAPSWRAGCPVALDALRYLTLTYRGFDGLVHSGELVVHADAVEAITRAFRTLFEAGYPIASMRLVDDFGADDDASMAADNTSAFNCRPIAGTSTWSEHAYGRAIDVNPVENPYVSRSGAFPPAGERFASRPTEPGVIHPGDVVVRAFAASGWSWGGAWRGPRDYQHFSATGR